METLFFLVLFILLSRCKHTKVGQYVTYVFFSESNNKVNLNVENFEIFLVQ
jgi:hypothetical protein